MMKRLIVPLLPVVLLVGCATGSEVSRAQVSLEDQLLGCFAQDSKTPASLRVVKKNGTYSLVSLSGDVPPGDSMHLFPMRTSLLSSPEFAGRVEAILATDPPALAVVKVGEGAIFKGKPLESNFYFAAPMVGGPLFKRECP